MKVSILRFIFAFIVILIPQFDAYADSIKVGISAPLSGTTASWGKDILNGVTFANTELANGRYELIVEDDQCNSQKAVSIAQKFVNIDSLKFTLGHACSGPLLSAAPIYEKAKVIAIGTTTSAAEISQAGDYIFRTWPSDAQGVLTLISYIKERHHRLGVITEQTDYAEGILRNINENKGNLEIFSEEYTPGTIDFRTLLLRLRKKGADAVLLNPQGDTTLLPMLTQLKQLHFDIPKYVMYYGASETVRNLAGDLTNNLLFADLPEGDVLATTEGKTLMAKFREKYEISFSPMVVMSAIESFRAIDYAIQNQNKPIDSLHSAKFNGTFGKWSFDENGDIHGVRFVMKKIINKQVVTLEGE